VGTVSADSIVLIEKELQISIAVPNISEGTAPGIKQFSVTDNVLSVDLQGRKMLEGDRNIRIQLPAGIRLAR
jgi:hypothetical protein